MAKKSKGRKKKRRRMSGGPNTIIPTGLSCTDANRKGMGLTARDVIKSRCIDRLASCGRNNKVIVTAICPTKGAGTSLRNSVNRFARAIKATRR